MEIKTDLDRLKQIDLARFFNKNERTIQRWHEQGLPRHGEGKGCYYVWAEVLPWYVAFVSGSKDGDEDSSHSARKDRADADIAEMKRDLMAGNLVDAMEVQRGWVDFLTRLRANLMGFPGRLVDRLESARDVREKLAIGNREMAATLREIVAEIEASAPVSEADGEDPEC